MHRWVCFSYKDCGKRKRKERRKERERKREEKEEKSIKNFAMYRKYRNLSPIHIPEHVAFRSLEFQSSAFAEFFQTHGDRTNRNAQFLTEFFRSKPFYWIVF